MSFVPIVPSTPTSRSPRTRELADLLARVIQEYEKHHPSVTGAEVRDAVRLAAQSSNKGAPAAGPAVALAVGLALFLAAGLAFFLRMSGTELSAPENVPVIAAIVVGLVLVVLLAVVKASRSP